MFYPQLIPDKTHNDIILWTDDIPLEDTKCVLIGLSDFAAKSNTICPDQFIDRNIWDESVTTCIEAGVINPTLSRASTYYNSWNQFTSHQLNIEKERSMDNFVRRIDK